VQRSCPSMCSRRSPMVRHRASRCFLICPRVWRWSWQERAAAAPLDERFEMDIVGRLTVDLVGRLSSIVARTPTTMGFPEAVRSLITLSDQELARILGIDYEDFLRYFHQYLGSSLEQAPTLVGGLVDIASVETLISESRRVLNENGVLMITDTHPFNLRELLRLSREWREYDSYYERARGRIAAEYLGLTAKHIGAREFEELVRKSAGLTRGDIIAMLSEYLKGGKSIDGILQTYGGRFKHRDRESGIYRKDYSHLLGWSVCLGNRDFREFVGRCLLMLRRCPATGSFWTG